MMLPHAGQKIGLALIVQFAQYIVQQKHRMLAEQLTDHGGLGQLEGQHAAALLPLTAKHPGGLAVQQDFQVLPVRSRQAEPGAQLCGAHGVHLCGQCLGGGGIGTHLVAHLQHLGAVGYIAVILRRDRGSLFQKLAAVLHDQRAVLRQLLLVGVQQYCAVWRNIVAFQQRILLGRQPHVAPQRHKVGPVYLTQRRIQKPAAPLGAALDQPQQIRLKHNGLKVPRQRGSTAHVRAVQPAGAAGPLARLTAHRQAYLFFDVLCLKRALYDRKVTAAADQLGILGAAEALAAGQQPDCLQQVRLALPVGAAQHGQVRVGVQHGMGKVAVVSQCKVGQAHYAPAATCTVWPSSSTVSPARHFLPRIVQTSPLTLTAPP